MAGDGEYKNYFDEELESEENSPFSPETDESSENYSNHQDFDEEQEDFIETEDIGLEASIRALRLENKPNASTTKINNHESGMKNEENPQISRHKQDRRNQESNRSRKTTNHEDSPMRSYGMNPKDDPDYRRDSNDYHPIENLTPSMNIQKQKRGRKASSHSQRKLSPSEMNQYPNYRTSLIPAPATPSKDSRRDSLKSPRSSKEISDQEATRGLPSCSVTITDLQNVIFSPTSKFTPGEVVLVPRTRGGFNYGRITKCVIKKHCFFSPQIEHKNQAWRIVYLSSGKSLFKELPAPYIGKLKDGPCVSRSDMQSTMEAEDQEFDTTRVIGSQSQFKDLQNVVFSPQSTFSIDEVVLIPRSNGGFTYGKVFKETTINCRISNFSDVHPLYSWRVIISDVMSNPVRKDLIAGCIGKLMGGCESAAYVSAKKTQAIMNDQAFTTVDASLALKKESELIEMEEAAKNKSVRRESQSPEEHEESNNVVLWGTPVDPRQYGVEPEVKKSKNENGKGQVNVSLNQIGGIIPVDKKQLLQTLMKPARDSGKPLIVIDGPNVAKKHGKDSDFSAKGIKIALDYWTSKGHDVVVFVPEHYVRRKPGQELTLKEYMPLSNNIPLLKQLVDAGSVILTPPQDYDDSYCIEYAIQHSGCIVTNDRYNDYIEKYDSQKSRKWKHKWIRDHCISFTFVRDDFFPNPDFVFPRITEVPSK